MKERRQDPEEYLYSLKRKGDKIGLDKVRDFLSRFNDPQGKYDTVIIGGTNGKGSVTTLVANTLTEAGYTTGKYISPHLAFFEERISVDKRLITKNELWSLIDMVKPVLEDIEADGPAKRPSFFEVLTTLAFLHYAERKVDIAVLEVGMGGRLDATNVTSHILSAITTVGLDHMDYLGTTKKEIAYEKAGIIRDGNYFVTGDKDPKVVDYFKKVCKERNAEFHHAFQRDFEIQESPLRLKIPEYGELEVPGIAKWQAENSLVALGVLEGLKEEGYKISKDQIIRGFSKTKLPGRLEILSKKPLVVIDSAHNVPGITELVNTLKKMDYKRLLLVIGILDDKDYGGMIEAIGPVCDHVFTAEPVSSRKLSSNILADELKNYCEANSFAHGIDALQEAIDMWRVGDIILVTGSIYLLGDIIKKMKGVE
ncbi:MAG: folylpolyglutamate synthase/dihydrofolate synthase family protein [Thermoplasmata archaeon]